MNIYKPTFLYIKKHNQTGLLYFGKTIKSDPTKYKGSGEYWLRHLKVHGNDVDTLWYCLFLDEDEIKEFALAFSAKHNIVESIDWANLVPENGINSGGPSGVTRSAESKERYRSAAILREAEKKVNGYEISAETRNKMSIASKRPHSEDTKRRMSEAQRTRFESSPGSMTGKTHTNEVRRRISESEKGKVISEETRRKISEAGKGRVVSESTRQKLRNRIVTDEKRKKLSESGRLAWQKRKSIT